MHRVSAEIGNCHHEAETSLARATAFNPFNHHTANEIFDNL